MVCPWLASVDGKPLAQSLPMSRRRVRIRRLSRLKTFRRPSAFLQFPLPPTPILVSLLQEKNTLANNFLIREEIFADYYLVNQMFNKN
jgi:hypothetical protein